MAQVAAIAHEFTSPEIEAFKKRPVDLVHLARHTLGNRDLEREVLQIFVRQSAIYLDRIRSAKSGPEQQMAAHTIKGSARGIGAWEVAECADVLENSASTPAALSQLTEAVEKTNSFILALLDTPSKA